MADESKKGSGDAPSQAAGYIYQLRYALYRALKRILSDPTGSIGIERLDDVALESSSAVVTLEQIKHTSVSDTEFSDSSPAIWRSIANWSQSIQSADLDLATLELVFVTNASITNGSALSMLTADDDDRNPSTAFAILSTVALESENERTKKDRARFLDLDLVVRTALVRAIRIVPNLPSLAALGEEIDEIIHYACDKDYLADFRAELEGWWFDRISGFLGKGKGALIPLIEVDSRVSYLREKYKTSALQIDVEEPMEHPDNLDEYIFVKQVEILKVSAQRIRNAQRNFLKASAQRSKWLRQAKIDPAELNNYDCSLEELWSTKASILHDELPISSSEDDNRKCGRELLGWAETRQNPLRGTSAQFLTSGSYHALADQLRLGWHPKFKQVFEPKS
jgi:hypothetical protein